MKKTEKTSQSLNYRKLHTFWKKDCCLKFGEENFRLPTPDEIKEFLHLNHWTQAEVAQLVGVSNDTVKKWCLKKESKGNRSITYAAWRLLILYSESRILKKGQNDIL
ncbi:hypothetical protein AltI4_21950 [Alteromonas sp. I4]|nr:hypothetical protein AltI4_21950 [Alteromonas sp. I4]